MDYCADVYTLTSTFYADYPSSIYPEIAIKKDRPYSCLLIEYMDDMFLCIPFRSNVRHQYAYHFKNSVRSRRCRSGLDYTKTVLIKDAKYIDDTVSAMVDQDEYIETKKNLPRIVAEVFKYVSDYKDDLNCVKKLHPKEWNRRYRMSTLPYFNDLLRV